MDLLIDPEYAVPAQTGFLDMLQRDRALDPLSRGNSEEFYRRYSQSQADTVDEVGQGASTKQQSMGDWLADTWYTVTTWFN